MLLSWLWLILLKKLFSSCKGEKSRNQLLTLKKKNIYLPHLVAATALVLPRLHPEAAELCPLGQGLAVQLLFSGGDVAVDRHGLPSSLYDFDLDPPSVLLPGKEGQSEVRLAEGDGEEAAARREENAGDFAERPAYRGSNFM